MENRVVIEFRKVCWRSMASRSRNVILMKTKHVEHGEERGIFGKQRRNMNSPLYSNHLR